MGCSSCKSSPTKTSEIMTRIKDSLDRDDTSALPHLLNLLNYEEKVDIQILINKPLIQLPNFKANLLSYSLWIGRPKSFEYLLTKLNASLQIMEDLFSVQKISTISVICEKAHIEILKIYLPLYAKTFKPNKEHREDTVTLSFSNNPIFQDNQNSYTPIQVACINGHLNIIKYLNDYFEIQYPPYTLDVHYIDELTGENCALLSVRSGNFVMMKFLHENLKADFHIKNAKQEGALQILAAATKFDCALQYLECVMYLVEVIKVDILYMHEETLLLLENNLIIKYIEEQLKREGVIVSKRELENIYKIKRCKPAEKNEEIEDLEEKEEKYTLIGDTQVISGIVPNSKISNFDVSFKINEIL